MPIEAGDAGETGLARRPGQFLLQQQVAEVVPDLVVAQMFWGHVVMLCQASDSADVVSLCLFCESEEFHVIENFCLIGLIMICLPVEVNRNGAAYFYLPERWVRRINNEGGIG